MAWTSGAGQSGVYVATIMAALTGVVFTGQSPFNVSVAASWRIALHNSASLTAGTAPIDFNATSVKWATTGEVTGTGWNAGASGGQLLSTAATGNATCAPNATISGEDLMYDMNDVSVASTTLANVRGCIIYCDACTGPTGPPDYSDCMLVAVCFGSDYSTNNGTFGIQWNASGVFTVDLTP